MTMQWVDPNCPLSASCRFSLDWRRDDMEWQHSAVDWLFMQGWAIWIWTIHVGVVTESGTKKSDHAKPDQLCAMPSRFGAVLGQLS